MKATIILLLFFPMLVKAQPKTIDVEGVSKQELFDRAVLWIAENFRSSNDVVQLKDKEEGTIVARGGLKYDAPGLSPGFNYSGYFEFTLKFECKENKYRYEISRVSHEATLGEYYTAGDLSGGKLPRRFKKVIQHAKEEIEIFKILFEKGMSVKTNNKDW